MVVKSTVPSFPSSPPPSQPTDSGARPPKPRVKANIRTRGKFGGLSPHPNPHFPNSTPAGKSSNFLLNSVSPDEDCTNPFLCPPKTTAAGRRPRVKSNVKAKKRNFWHGPGSTGPNGGTRRKIRRGRKIIRKPDNLAIFNEIPDDIEATVSVPEEAETEQFIPTVRTFATTTPRPFTTARTTTTTEESDSFEDFFDSQNDLFVASSTVSSVVFKGSPTPGGWASSPAPNFDGSGAQVTRAVGHD